MGCYTGDCHVFHEVNLLLLSLASLDFRAIRHSYGACAMHKKLLSDCLVKNEIFKRALSVKRIQYRSYR